MRTPFIYGKIASDKDFTDRRDEIEKLVNNFLSSVNTILISPRRWGKSSLVIKASKIAVKKNKNLKFCFIDLNNVRNEEEFYQQLSTQVLKTMSGRTQLIIDNARKFLGRFIPNISISPDPGSNIKLSMDWREVVLHPDEVLDLAEKLCAETEKRMIICLDEFQNIGEFKDPDGLQKKMRAHWQKHRKVSYCLYGSKKHMMMNVFTSSSMPFYRFGDIFFIQKITVADWVSFITKRFKETGKSIGKSEASLIASLADCHPYYVQQLAQQCWLRTDKICDEIIIQASYESIILQLSMLYQNLSDQMSSTQINFLKALLNNESQLSSKEVLFKYNLGTSANVLRIKKYMMDKEILDINRNKINFQDPLYKAWLEKYYFKIRK